MIKKAIAVIMSDSEVVEYVELIVGKSFNLIFSLW